MYVYVYTCNNSRQNKGKQTSNSREKRSALLSSLHALPTKPPRQLSRLGTSPGNNRRCKATKPDKQVNSKLSIVPRPLSLLLGGVWVRG